MNGVYIVSDASKELNKIVHEFASTKMERWNSYLSRPFKIDEYYEDEFEHDIDQEKDKELDLLAEMSMLERASAEVITANPYDGKSFVIAKRGILVWDITDPDMSDQNDSKLPYMQIAFSKLQKEAAKKSKVINHQGRILCNVDDFGYISSMTWCNVTWYHDQRIIKAFSMSF